MSDKEIDNNNLWQQVSFLVDELQGYADRPEKYGISESRDLLIKLLTTEELPGIPQSELSIVYCEYGTQSYELISSSEINDSEQKNFEPNNQYIQRVVTEHLDEKDYPWFETTEACVSAGFSNYGSVLIVPMRLSEKRNIGAFVLHSDDENKYDETLRRVMDVLSDRLASLIRSLRRLFRDRISYELRNRLLKRVSARSKIGSVEPIKGESEILQNVYDHFKSHWFEGKNEKIHILIKNSLNTNTYFLATDGSNEVGDNFRTEHAYSREELGEIFLSEENYRQLNDASETGGMMAYKGLYNNFEETDSHPKGCSWLGVSIIHPEGYLFGHIILHNTSMQYAFDSDDLHFVDSIADFTGFLLAEYRERETESAISQLMEYSLTENDKEDVKNISEVAANYLHDLYGVNKNTFRIISLEHKTQRWKTEWPYDCREVVSNKLQNLVVDHVNDQRRLIEQGVVNKERPYNQQPLSHEGRLVSPMRNALPGESDDYRVVGAFLIPASKPGMFATAVIDKISDVIGMRINSIYRKKRYQAITDFTNAVALMSSEYLTVEVLLDIAHKSIRKVMFSDNLYIALYDENKDEISFPLILKNGNPWEAMIGKSRKVDPERLGRTEYIIRDHKPLLIRTLEESESWYQLPNHAEHAGNPLASWVGVPVFDSSKSGVRGVIAAYHESLEYVYTKRDEYFLELVAGAVAGLFRSLRLKETNQQLEKAQSKIAEQQHVLSTALLSQDLTHRLNNTIGAASINVDQAVRDILYVRESKDFDIFDFTTEALKDVDVILKDLVKEIRSISSDDQQPINVVELIRKVVKQIEVAHRLKDKGIKPSFDISNEVPLVSGHYRTLFNTFGSLLQNATHAVLSAKDNDEIHAEIIVRVRFENGCVVVSVIDTGVPIQASVETHLFEYGVSSKGSSGFGLWRAKTVSEKLGGSLTFSKHGKQKIFTMRLPCDSSAGTKSVAYILDDERSWRGILTRWMTEAGYSVKAASNAEEMMRLLESNEYTPSCILLDVSLDKEDGANYDGLSLISKMKKRFPSTKIVIVSGFPEAAESYERDVGAILPKIDADGKILTKAQLMRAIDV